jgi:hypothetical protein
MTMRMCRQQQKATTADTKSTIVDPHLKENKALVLGIQKHPSDNGHSARLQREQWGKNHANASPGPYADLERCVLVAWREKCEAAERL